MLWLPQIMLDFDFENSNNEINLIISPQLLDPLTAYIADMIMWVVNEKEIEHGYLVEWHDTEVNLTTRIPSRRVAGNR